MVLQLFGTFCSGIFNYPVSLFVCSPLSIMIEGSLNSKLPTIWRVEKQMKSR